MIIFIPSPTHITFMSHPNSQLIKIHSQSFVILTDISIWQWVRKPNEPTDDSKVRMHQNFETVHIAFREEPSCLYTCFQENLHTYTCTRIFWNLIYHPHRGYIFENACISEADFNTTRTSYQSNIYLLESGRHLVVGFLTLMTCTSVCSILTFTLPCYYVTYTTWYNSKLRTAAYCNISM